MLPHAVSVVLWIGSGKLKSERLTGGRGRCDANEQYADLINDSTEISDLSTESWIASANSYVCMTPLVL